jgi:hypothetical protein
MAHEGDIKKGRLLAISIRKDGADHQSRGFGFEP